MKYLFFCFLLGPVVKETTDKGRQVEAPATLQPFSGKFLQTAPKLPFFLMFLNRQRNEKASNYSFILARVTPVIYLFKLCLKRSVELQ